VWLYRAAGARIGHHGGVTFLRLALGSVPLLLAISCAKPNDANAPSNPAPSASAAPPRPRVVVVEGSVLVRDCPAKLHPSVARKTLDALAGDCQTVPGGRARFLATLEPGGRIDISATDGTDQGTIPICVLKNKLRHKLFIRKSCTLEVTIEEASMAAP